MAKPSKQHLTLALLASMKQNVENVFVSYIKTIAFQSLFCLELHTSMYKAAILNWSIAENSTEVSQNGFKIIVLN